MSFDAVATSLAADVAAKVRAEMAYQRCGQEQVAATLRVSQAAVSRRLTGVVPFDVGELIAVARLLGKPVTDFLPSDEAVSA